jgi:DNA repair exonuclease SbcCD ATPase subunit
VDIKKELQSSIRESQNSISKVNGDISAKKRIINYKESETKKAEEGICPILKTSCTRIGKQMTISDKKQLSSEIVQLNQEIEQLNQSIIGDQDYLADLEMQMQELDFKIEKARRKSIRLESAFQFKDYKYTKADIVIYDEAIKVLDSFAGEYIKEWLSNLSIIINNLLNPINISVEFSAEKDFLKVKDNGQILKYDQLSTGQRCFLSVIFKLAILMQQNKTGIILMDDGLNNLDAINLTNLINICKTLPFQIIAVYQSKIAIEDVKQLTVIRENGMSKIQ